MSSPSPEIVERTLNDLERFTEELLEVLHDERQALVTRSLPDLERLTAEKARLCQQLDAAVAGLGALTLDQQIGALPAPCRGRLEPRRERLRELAAEVQKCNAVNGKIVHRSQQSVRELMHLMSGTDTEPLYSAQGYRAQGTSLGRSPGTAIAKA
ncbi:MAG TPA: flagellar export chaperone FlgN [Pseudomonadales bacterium]